MNQRCLEMNRFFYPYVRFIDEGKVVEELLFAKKLTTDTKGETIFNLVDQLFKQKKFLCKI